MSRQFPEANCLLRYSVLRQQPCCPQGTPNPQRCPEEREQGRSLCVLGAALGFMVWLIAALEVCRRRGSCGYECKCMNSKARLQKSKLSHFQFRVESGTYRRDLQPKSYGIRPCLQQGFFTTFQPVCRLMSQRKLPVSHQNN